MTYCLKCKKKTETKDLHPTTLKNGRKAMTGKCSVCGTTKYQLIKS